MFLLLFLGLLSQDFCCLFWWFLLFLHFLHDTLLFLYFFNTLLMYWFLYDRWFFHFPLGLLLKQLLSFLLQFLFYLIGQFFVVSLNFVGKDGGGRDEKRVETHYGIYVIGPESGVLQHSWKFLFVQVDTDFEQHFDREKSEYSTGGLSGSTSPYDHNIAILAHDVFLLLSQLDSEIWNFLEQFHQILSTVEIHIFFQNFLIYLSHILVEFESFCTKQGILTGPPHFFLAVDQASRLNIANVRWFKGCWQDAIILPLCLQCSSLDAVKMVKRLIHDLTEQQTIIMLPS